MNSGSSRISEFLPLSALDFQVLLILKDAPLHGYGIVQAAADLFPEEPDLEIGSLYRIVARLLDDGLIREVEHTSRRPSDGRKRRYYQTTSLGLRVARAEAARLKTLLRSPPATELLEGS